MARVQQNFSLGVTKTGQSWKNDVALETPELLGPEDGFNLCIGLSLPEQITLSWRVVPGADFYMVQWSLSGSFQGPTFRSKKIAAPTTEYTLILDEDIRQRDMIHWRVAAVSNTGGASQKSDARTLELTCDEEDKEEGGGGGGGGGPDAEPCKRYDVKIKITGPDTIMCCDAVTYKMDVTYNCKNQDGDALATLTSTDWQILANPADANIVITDKGAGSCTVRATCEKSQKARIRAIAKFTDDQRGGAPFECFTDFDVNVDCDTGFPYRKPWLDFTIDHYGNYGSTSTYTGLQDSTIDPSGSDSFRTIPPTQGQTVMNPPQVSGGSGTKNVGAPLGVINLVHVVAMGPVALTETKQNAPAKPNSGGGEEGSSNCGTSIGSGAVGGEIKESRTHLGFGCGLKVVDTLVQVDNDHLVGLPPSRRGLKTYGDCSIQIAYGCGLTLGGVSKEDLTVNTQDIAGQGLVAGLLGGLDYCILHVDYGCGITLDDGQALTVNPSDLAGTGLSVGSGCSLNVDVTQLSYGCGLTIVDGKLSVVGTPREVVVGITTKECVTGEYPNQVTCYVIDQIETATICEIQCCS